MTAEASEADMAARASHIVDNFVHVVSRINAVASATRPVCTQLFYAADRVDIMAANYSGSTGPSGCGIEKETSF